MKLINEGAQVVQTFAAPSIYFDHWAIRAFSDDVALQDRLVQLVHRKEATFVLSAWNMAEFAGPSDPKHAEDAERFLDRLMPNIYLSDFNLEEALRRDDWALARDVRAFMPPYRWALKMLGDRSASTAAPLTTQGLLTQAHAERDRLGPFVDATKQGILEAFQVVKADPAYIEKARKSKPSDPRPRLWVVLSELMRDFTLDPKAQVETNDVADLFHAALPVMACDFVLLDAAWVSRVKRLAVRAQEGGYALPLAQCFSRRDDGLARFLDALEAFEKRRIPETQQDSSAQSRTIEAR